MLNHIVIQGRLGRDPELRTTNTSKATCTVGLAVDRQGRDKGTDWIQCVFWERDAETLIRYCHKGDQIIVEGRLQVRKYTGRDGAERTVSEVVANRFHFCGNRRDAEQSYQTLDGFRQGAAVPVTEMPADTPVPFEQIGMEDDGELPF